MSDPSKEYEVGYKCPPREHQFKPGQSGNPKGRPKQNKDLAANLEEELDEIITIQEKGKIKNITKRKALAKRLSTDALNGKVAAIKMIISILASKSVEEDESDEGLSEDDAQILDNYIRRIKNGN